MNRRKSVPRRFVPGHTAFKCMSGVPMLERVGMATVAPEERERCFRGVVPSDKWLPNRRKEAGDAAGTPQAAPTEEDEEDEFEDVHDEEVPV